MARMISEQEKRARRHAAKRAKQRQVLEARGYSVEDAAQLLRNLDRAQVLDRKSVV